MADYGGTGGPRPQPGIVRGYLNYPWYSSFYLIKSAVIELVQRSPYYPWSQYCRISICSVICFMRPRATFEQFSIQRDQKKLDAAPEQNYFQELIFPWRINSRSCNTQSELTKWFVTLMIGIEKCAGLKIEEEWRAERLQTKVKAQWLKVPTRCKP